MSPLPHMLRTSANTAPADAVVAIARVIAGRKQLLHVGWMRTCSPACIHATDSALQSLTCHALQQAAGHLSADRKKRHEIKYAA